MNVKVLKNFKIKKGNKYVEYSDLTEKEKAEWLNNDKCEIQIGLEPEFYKWASEINGMSLDEKIDLVISNIDSLIEAIRELNSKKIMGLINATKYVLWGIKHKAVVDSIVEGKG